MIFGDNIVSVGENREEINQRLDVWKLAFERKGFRISLNKREYWSDKRE